jgi:hypothetical protein
VQAVRERKEEQARREEVLGYCEAALNITMTNLPEEAVKTAKTITDILNELEKDTVSIEVKANAEEMLKACVGKMEAYQAKGFSNAQEMDLDALIRKVLEKLKPVR